MKKILFACVIAFAGLAQAETEADREMKRVIVESGKTCERVTKAVYSGPRAGSLLFSVACGDQQYLVTVKPDATGEVMSCKAAASMGVRCFANK